MITNFRLLTLIGTLLLLTGCLYDHAPSGPSQGIDTWLLGQWETVDKASHHVTATVTTVASDRYHVSFCPRGGRTLEFDGWISRVGGFSILVLNCTSEGKYQGKCSLYHYELLAPGTPTPGGIGATRIRISELQLDETSRTLEPYELRKAIRAALKDGTLLVPHDVVAELKKEQEDIPGSVIWTKTGGVTKSGVTF